MCYGTYHMTIRQIQIGKPLEEEGNTKTETHAREVDQSVYAG